MELLINIRINSNRHKRLVCSKLWIQQTGGPRRLSLSRKQAVWKMILRLMWAAETVRVSRIKLSTKIMAKDVSGKERQPWLSDLLKSSIWNAHALSSVESAGQVSALSSWWQSAWWRWSWLSTYSLRQKHIAPLVAWWWQRASPPMTSIIPTKTTIICLSNDLILFISANIRL